MSAGMNQLAAALNAETIKALQAERRVLKRALRKIASGAVAREFGFRAVFEYERIAREVLQK